MTKYEDALAEMRAGVNWDKVEIKYAKSTMYNAFNPWKETSKKEYTQLSAELQDINTRVKSAREELQAAEAERAAEDDRLRATREKTLKADEELSEKTRQLIEVEAKKAKLDDGITQLASRGLTPDTVGAVVSSDVESVEDLRERVGTGSAHRKLHQENKRLVEANDSLNGRIVEADAVLNANLKAGNAKLGEVKAQTRSELNKLDELKAEHMTMMPAIDMVMNATRRGYTIPMQVSLYNHIQASEIKGQPVASVERLIHRLDTEKGIAERDSELERKEAQLTVVNEKLNTAKGVLEGYKGGALKVIQDVELESKRGITSVRDSSIASIQQVRDGAIGSMSRIESEAAARGQSIYNKWDSEVRYVQKNVIDAYGVTINSLATYKKQTDDWGNARQASGRLEREIQEAALLLSIRNDPKAIGDIPPDIMLRTIRSVDSYTRIRLPDATSLPSEQLKKDDRYGLALFYPVKLCSLTAWLAEDFERRIREGKL